MGEGSPSEMSVDQTQQIEVRSSKGRLRNASGNVSMCV